MNRSIISVQTYTRSRLLMRVGTVLSLSTRLLLRFKRILKMCINLRFRLVYFIVCPNTFTVAVCAHMARKPGGIGITLVRTVLAVQHEVEHRALEIAEKYLIVKNAFYRGKYEYSRGNNFDNFLYSTTLVVLVTVFFSTKAVKRKLESRIFFVIKSVYVRKNASRFRIKNK